MLARCLPDAGEVPACLLACMPCRSECSENVDYDRNHHEDQAVWERGAEEVLGEVLASAGRGACLPACMHALSQVFVWIRFSFAFRIEK